MQPKPKQRITLRSRASLRPILCRFSVLYRRSVRHCDITASYILLHLQRRHDAVTSRAIIADSAATSLWRFPYIFSEARGASEKCNMCFYDLQKAFESVQYPILLKRLYEAGIDGRAWRLLHISKEHGEGGWLFIFHVHAERGVLQGSVLSPVLFLLIMDPLLKSLQSKGLGPSIGGTYARWGIYPC